MVKYSSCRREAATAEGSRETLKKIERNFKKGIDKGKTMWYNSQAVREEQRKVIEN